MNMGVVKERERHKYESSLIFGEPVKPLEKQDQGKP